LIVLTNSFVLSWGGIDNGGDHEYTSSAQSSESNIYVSADEKNVVLNVWSLACAIAGTQLLVSWGRKPSALACQFSLIVTLYIIGGLSKVYADNEAANATSSNALIYGNTACIFLFQGFYS
jgi:hypothetical protein